MQISDEIGEIVFRNDDNGYSVVRLKNSGTTVTGVFAHLSTGLEVVLTGDYVNNAKYGRQFQATSCEFVPPTSPSKIKKFIGSGLIEGIGPVTADRIVKTFGKDTLSIMEHAPEELVAVRGISLKKAKVIGEKFSTIKGMQAVVMFLQKFDISLNMAMRIYKHYGEKTIERVQVNPYSLIETIDGIGFLTADKIAKDLGHEYSGSFRVRAGIIYVLRQTSEQDGHTFLPREKLCVEACKLLRIKREELDPVFEEVIQDLCIDKYLSLVNQHAKDGEVVQGYMLAKFYLAEKNIATKLNLMVAGTEEGRGQDLDKMLKHYEKLNNIKLHDKQSEAIKLATTSGVSVITGGPGTGKTTIVRAILYLNEAAGKTVKLLAPTGRAAKRLEETTGRVASTIHRALNIDFRNSSNPFAIEDEPIDADIIIVDEFSMCDVALVNQLLKKVLPDTQLIIVGDVDQLPSVSAGAVLADIINSGVIPVVCLTEIYRQSEQSQIVFAAHDINRGVMPDITNKSSDFFFETAASLAQIKEKVVALASTRIPGYLKIDHDKIQVLCPMKIGEAGMNSLNLALQEAVNPGSISKVEYEYKTPSQAITFRVGDRVMQTVNNYNQEWTKAGVNEIGSGVYNGDIGKIISINRQNGEIVVGLEDGRVTVYSRSDLASVVLAYAITVHKSQGCEFDVVIIPVTSGAYMIFTRNLLYTAVTRAKKMVVLVGDVANIEKMVNNTYTKKRHTMLREFLVRMKEKAGELYGV